MVSFRQLTTSQYITRIDEFSVAIFIFSLVPDIGLTNKRILQSKQNDNYKYKERRFKQKDLNHVQPMHNAVYCSGFHEKHS